MVLARKNDPAREEGQVINNQEEEKRGTGKAYEAL